MPSSLAGVLIAIAAVLPGFVIAELSTVGRPAAKRSDLEIVLRALFYALLLHLCAGEYTRWLVERVGSLDGWKDHLGAISIYTLLILVITPILIGVMLNVYFRAVERRPNSPGRFYEFLGARDSGCAADLLFTRLYRGAWLIVEMIDGSYVGGRFGEGSMAGQSPDEHDLYIDEMWEVDPTSGPDPVLTGALSPRRGIYLPAAQIRSIRVENPSD
jgi:hypothetical protein